MHPTIALEQKYGARHYAPLPIVLTRGEGIYVWDDTGKRYIDMMSAYSAVSHGHAHPRLLNVFSDQANQLAIISRAYYSDKLAAFQEHLCQLTGQDKIMVLNTGAEAVEAALKAARKWAYKVKKVPENCAEIIVCQGNFHGRTLGIVSFSSEAQYRDGFGPFLPGFKTIPFNDAGALEKVITPNTAAFLVEPIQGEGGVRVPEAGYLKRCQEICRQHNVLLMCDEIQTGLGRTGRLLASDHEEVKPDVLMLGKALGGALLPVSAVLARHDVMDVFTPGDHGSTFGGNPLAASVALEALQILEDESLIEQSAKLGDYLLESLSATHQNTPLVKAVRGKGLFVGIEINPELGTAREVCLQLMAKGLLSKETHETVVRLAPPLVITQAQLESAIIVVNDVLQGFSSMRM